MEAEDTVIKQGEGVDGDMVTCPNCHANYVVLYHRIREAQAEISFKAGVERGWEQAEAHYYIDTG